MARTHYKTTSSTAKKDKNSTEALAKIQSQEVQRFHGAITDLLIDKGLLTAKQVEYAERVRKKLVTPKNLLSVLEELKFISRDRIWEVLRENPIETPLGNLLVELGYLCEEDIRVALQNQKEKESKKLGEVLVDLHFILENELIKILSYQLGVEYIDPLQTKIDKSFCKLSLLNLGRENDFIPVKISDDGGNVLVAFADPLNAEQINTARGALDSDITIAIARKSAIHEAIGKIEKDIQQVKHGKPNAIDHNDNVIVQTVNNMFIASIKAGASDIHIQPTEHELQIRFRIDGVLMTHEVHPLEMAPALTSRIKIMAGANIAERRRHQDGRIYFESKEYKLDLRVSIYATIFGEKIVMRLLSSQSDLLTLDQLGMAPMTLLRFKEEALSAPSGVVIVTGPTGSGKTSTLYSAVNHLNDSSTSIITAEDPVEYVIDGIAQCSINEQIGLTFEETLKHIVRQDPDIIVIGEIRDKFSVEIAIQSALTGHKVLTTFHTEDSTGALIRLLNMNIEPFLIASTIVGVLAQRLVRRVCPKCAVDSALTLNEIRQLGYDATKVKQLSFKKGPGCSFCRYTGYKGRAAIHELLLPNEYVKEAVIAKKTTYEIRRICIQTARMATLIEDGIYKAHNGVTSFDELMRQLPRLSIPRQIGEIERILDI